MDSHKEVNKMGNPEHDGSPQHPATILLGNVLVSGDDVLLHYELTKTVLAFANRNEVMTHKLIGLLEATKHGLLTYTDMVCVSGEPEMEEEDDEQV